MLELFDHFCTRATTVQMCDGVYGGRNSSFVRVLHFPLRGSRIHRIMWSVRPITFRKFLPFSTPFPRRTSQMVLVSFTQPLSLFISAMPRKPSSFVCWRALMNCFAFRCGRTTLHTNNLLNISDRVSCPLSLCCAAVSAFPDLFHHFGELLWWVQWRQNNENQCKFHQNRAIFLRENREWVLAEKGKAKAPTNKTHSAREWRRRLDLQ